MWFQLAYYCLRPWPWIMVAFVALAMYPELRAVAALFAAGLICSVLPLTGFIIFGETKSAIFSGAVAIVCGTVTLLLVKRLTRAS